jgi:diguanylate cyclase (GGDEF)-like protein/PAS domain S-box-containing protein
MDGVGNLAAQVTMYRAIVENTIDIIIRYNAQRQRVYVSPACREMLGYEPEELQGTEPSATIHSEDFAMVHPRFLRFGPLHPRTTATFRMRRKDGTYIWVEGHYRYLPEDGTSIAVLRDVTDRKNAELLLEEANRKLAEANAILRQLAQQDGMTGLANRRRFDELLATEFQRAAREQVPLAVLLLDVDCFKAYNDLHGHLSGDECLRLVAGATASALKRPGDLAARYGGEEFVVLLPQTELAGALAVGEDIRAAVADLRVDHPGSLYRHVTISVGAASIMPLPGGNPSGLVEAADRALYRAKSDGRNRVCGAAEPALVPV